MHGIQWLLRAVPMIFLFQRFPTPQCMLAHTQPDPYHAGAKLSEHFTRSEEHTSELQSPCNLVCRLLLEKKNKYTLSVGRDFVRKLFRFFLGLTSGCVYIGDYTIYPIDHPGYHTYTGLPDVNQSVLLSHS